MNPRLLLALSSVVLAIKVASCAYQPWEEIKKWYNDAEYDREGADARNSEMEKNCTDITGENDGLCFDECMFRNQYKLIHLLPPNDETGFLYMLFEDQGLRNLEKNVLQLKRLVEKTEYDEPEHKILAKSLWPCDLAFDMHLDTDTKLRNNYLETIKNLCTLTVNEEEKEKMTSIVNCINKHIINN